MKLCFFQPAWDLFDLNPYCMKVEAALRFAAIGHDYYYSYESEGRAQGPWPVLVDRAITLADSGCILRHLREQGRYSLDERLNEQQQALTTLVTRVLEERLYSVILYSRLLDPRGLAIFKEQVLTPDSGYDDVAVASLIERMTKIITGRGFNVADEEGLYQHGLSDLQAVTTFLPETACFFGDAPASIDAVLYAFFMNILAVPLSNPLQRYLQSQPRVVDYCARITQRYQFG